MHILYENTIRPCQAEYKGLIVIESPSKKLSEAEITSVASAAIDRLKAQLQNESLTDTQLKKRYEVLNQKGVSFTISSKNRSIHFPYTYL